VLALVAGIVLFGLQRRFRSRPLGSRGKIPVMPVINRDPPPTIIDTIYAIGDLHGDVHCARQWVAATNLFDPTFSSWLQPNAQLVFVGDYIDKGPTSLQTANFVKNLTDAFPDRVTALMGNHEMEALLDRSPASDRRFYFYQLPYSTVHPDELLNYIPPESVTSNTTKALDILYDLALNEIYAKNKFRSIDFSPFGPKSVCNLISDPDLSSMVREELASLQAHYIASFASSTELGQWMEKRPITYVFEDLVFMHGGLNPAVLEVDGGIRSLEDLGKLNEKFLNQSSDTTIASFMRTLDGQIVYDLLTYRGNHKSCMEVSNVASALGLSKIVVGHTPDDDVRMVCDDKFLAIDSALGRWIRVNGNQYCRGEETKSSANGRYTCDTIGSSCEGQIVKMVKSNTPNSTWAVELLSLI